MQFTEELLKCLNTKVQDFLNQFSCLEISV